MRDVSPVTPNVLVTFVAPLTSRVPCISVLPVADWTVNLSVPSSNCIANSLLSAFNTTLFWNVATPSTFRVPSKSVA